MHNNKIVKFIKEKLVVRNLIAVFSGEFHNKLVEEQYAETVNVVVALSLIISIKY